jgi:hypothetical protein
MTRVVAAAPARLAPLPVRLAAQFVAISGLLALLLLGLGYFPAVLATGLVLIAGAVLWRSYRGTR